MSKARGDKTTDRTPRNANFERMHSKENSLLSKESEIEQPERENKQHEEMVAKSEGILVCFRHGRCNKKVSSHSSKDYKMKC